jgi:mono/diheme cytochrome c family protein
MSRRGGIATAVAALTVALAAGAMLGCAAVGGLDGDAAGGAAGAAGGHGLASVPTSAPERVNPFGESPDAVAAGRKLFLRHCAECHGDAGRGGRRGPSLDSRRLRQASPGALFWFLTNGRLAAGMPEWSRLPAARRWQIIAYLQSKVVGPSPREGLSPPAPFGRGTRSPKPVPLGPLAQRAQEGRDPRELTHYRPGAPERAGVYSTATTAHR